MNKPKVPVHTYHRDGQQRFDDNYGGAVNYEPNSMGGPVQDPQYVEPPLRISGDASRYDHREGNDDYTQPGNLFRLMPEDAKQRTMDNFAEAMQGVPEEIQLRQIAHFAKADPAWGAGVAARLGLEVPGQAAATAAE